MCKNAEKWVFCIDQDFTWSSGLTITEDVAFLDLTGVRRLELRRGGEVRVLKDYAWDGCTPKFCLLDLVFGIPDGVVDSRTKKPKTYYASMVHDALYQFLSDGLPLKRRDADRCFLMLMSETGFVLRYPYYWAVRLFGGMFRRIGKWKRKTSGRMILLKEQAWKLRADETNVS